MFNLNIHADITKVTTDPCYAKSKNLKVKEWRRDSVKLQELENDLRKIASDDPNWREKVDNFKREISAEKNSITRYIIKYDKCSINAENQNTLGLFRSVITSGNNILSFAPPKSLSFDKFDETSAEEDRKYQEFVEGTMINLYFDPDFNDWEIATRSNIGARCKFFNSDKTFRKMFLEAFTKQNLEFNNFDKQYCYSFVLQHPENRIVVPFATPKIILTKIYDCQDNSIREIPCDNCKLNIQHVNKLNVSGNEYNDLNLKKIHEMFSQSEVKDYTCQGAVICDKKLGIRCKVRNPNYEYVRNLKGNNPKLQYQYYCLRQSDKVKEYLKFYPEDGIKLGEYRKQLHIWTGTLHQNYFRCYINKEKPLRDFPFEYRSHMYKLHEHYKNKLRETGGAVTRKVVIEYVNNLPPQHLMSSVNYPLRHVEKAATVEELQDALATV